MLDNNDIEKLKTVFATKEDLKSFATKQDLKAQGDKFEKQLKAQGESFERSLGVFTEEIKSQISSVAELVIGIKESLDGKIDDHEERITNLEHKVV